MSADRDRNEAGFSLIESVIMLVVIAALSGLIVQSIRGLAAAQLFTREQARVVSIAERVVQDVAHDLRFAVRVFSESDESRSMLAKLEIDAKGILGGSRMCIPNSDGVFAIDQAGSPVTGNMLFFGASLPHETLDLSPLQTHLLESTHR